MTEPKHTPGPWRWINSQSLVADYGRRRAILTSASIKRCGEGGLLVPFEGFGPDARLIAAAPDLLAVLEEFVSDVRAATNLPNPSIEEVADLLDWPDMVETYKKAIAIIAKAKGGL